MSKQNKEKNSWDNWTKKNRKRIVIGEKEKDGKKYISVSRSDIGTDKNIKRIYLSLGSWKMMQAHPGRLVNHSGFQLKSQSP